MSLSQRALGYWRESRNSYEFAALVWLLAMPVFMFFFVPGRHGYIGLAFSSIFAGLVGATANIGRARYLAYLQSRVVENRPIQWSVVVNGVTAGQIDDASYVSLRHGTYSDNRVWAAQLQCYASAMLNILARIAYVMPLAIVWGVIALALFRPGDLISMFSVMAHASSSDITAAALNAINYGFVATLLFGGVIAFSGAEPKRVLDDAVAVKVRRRIGVVAEGDIALTRIEESDVLNYTEDERSDRRKRARMERQRRHERS